MCFQGLAGEDYVPNEIDLDDGAVLRNILEQGRGDGAVKREEIARILYPND